jgi:hypothetical protein
MIGSIDAGAVTRAILLHINSVAHNKMRKLCGYLAVMNMRVRFPVSYSVGRQWLSSRRRIEIPVSGLHSYRRLNSTKAQVFS